MIIKNIYLCFVEIYIYICHEKEKKIINLMRKLLMISYWTSSRAPRIFMYLKI